MILVLADGCLGSEEMEVVKLEEGTEGPNQHSQNRWAKLVAGGLGAVLPWEQLQGFLVVLLLEVVLVFDEVLSELDTSRGLGSRMIKVRIEKIHVHEILAVGRTLASIHRGDISNENSQEKSASYHHA